MNCIYLRYDPFPHLCNALLVIFLCVAGSVCAKPKTIVAFGDSLTQGYGLPADAGFVPQLGNWLLVQGVSVRMVNAGVSGDTTAGGLARLDWTVAELPLARAGGPSRKKFRVGSAMAVQGIEKPE